MYRGIVYTVFIGCVGWISRCTVIVGLYIIACCTRSEVSECSEGVGGGGGGVFCPQKNVPGVLRRKKLAGGGGGEMYKFFFTTKFCFQKMFLGPETQQKNWRGGGRFWGVWGHGSRWVRKRCTSSFDHDRPKLFWNDPPWRSKVIIRKPWQRKNKKQEKNNLFWQNHLRHSRWGMPNCIPRTNVRTGDTMV